jgi:hypothetical protein
MTVMVDDKTDDLKWKVHYKVEKYKGDWNGEEIDAGLAGDPYDVVEGDGNLLLIGGVSALFQQLIGSAVITPFNNANARIGVGDSVTAAVDTQTDLQAATNKTYKAMDATYPQHTDSVSVVGAKTITFRSTFASADANYAWQEWIIDNGATQARRLNRKVASLGTKASGASWVFTVTVALA